MATVRIYSKEDLKISIDSFHQKTKSQLIDHSSYILQAIHQKISVYVIKLEENQITCLVVKIDFLQIFLVWNFGLFSCLQNYSKTKMLYLATVWSHLECCEHCGPTTKGGCVQCRQVPWGAAGVTGLYFGVKEDEGQHPCSSLQLPKAGKWRGRR